MAGKHPSSAELRAPPDPVICQIHNDRVERLISSVETLSTDLRDLIVHKETTALQLRSIGESLSEMRSIQSTIASNVTNIQLAQQMQSNEINALKRRLDDQSDNTKKEMQRLKDQVNIHSEKIHNADTRAKIKEEATALTKKRSGPFQMGEGWISVAGLVKILGAVAALIAAYYGGKAT